MTPRNFPPAPGWSPTGHRIKVPLDYERGPEKAWVYGALCVRNGQALTQTASSRNTAGYLDLLQALNQTYPAGDLFLVADNLASHGSGLIQDWLAAHPRVQHAFIPVGAAWLNLIEGWWRIFRRKAVTGVSLADAADIAYATRLATAQINRHARPWGWGRPAPPHRTLRRCFVYRLCGTKQLDAPPARALGGTRGHHALMIQVTCPTYRRATLPTQMRPATG